MPANTDIANRSLSKVGGSRITSFTQGVKNSNTVNDIFEDLRDELLDHPWNFASKRVKLAKSATAPVFGWDHAYPLQSDHIRLRSVHDNTNGTGSVIFNEEQHEGALAIVTSADPIYIRYVARVTDPNLWSVGFRRAFILALARDLAIPISGSKLLLEKLTDEAKRALAGAKSVDALTSYPERRPVGSWAGSRRITSYSDHYQH